MVHLAPLTPVWPTDLLVVALILIIKMRTNICTCNNHVHTTCAQYIIMNMHKFGARAMRRIRHHGMATQVNKDFLYE